MKRKRKAAAAVGRLGRLLKAQDTLARLSGDQFALILLSEREPARIVAFAETMRRTLRAPIGFNDREIFITASIGLALAEDQSRNTEEVLKDAELAMYHAKRIGGDADTATAMPSSGWLE